ncbi:hypothetical protein GGU10DRAFT_429163 [Lentinula aff. detonsa]|uniref:NAD(P)-binding protein n=1 Tax=Lentinula aff. detonsa TaxID=2804958 RepID=A0AA38NKI0_9AGAR|nr:hypothetical protein GGU10DRAFT_429163 [Lentinula aff. detonsa]
MVSLSEIYTSNALITSSLPPRLVAVFVGGTSGIGESTLKAFVSYAVQPKIYILGRNNASAERIIGECKFLGPEGHVGEAEVVFLQADLSSMKTVEGTCEDIKRREGSEGKINFLFLSTGTPSFDRSLTPEGLHAFLASAYYDRMLIIHLLAPLLLSATDSHPGLARVVSVACGCDEGIIEPSDFSALRIPSSALRGHIGTLTTLTLEALATNTGPDTSITFIHANPGLVRTPYQDRMTGAFGVFARGLMWVKKITGEAIGIEESGERHLYLLTSARYPPGGVPIKGGALSAIGTNGLRANEGSKAGAVYSVDKNGEPAGEHVVNLLTKYREEGMVDRLWVWLKGEYYRAGVVLS